jgi:hypothetical protein
MFKFLLELFKDEFGGTLSITRKSANTLITAAGFNNNFSEIEAVINGSIEATNIAADAVTAAKINVDVVRSGYGLAQHTDGSLYVDVSDTNPGLEISDGGVRAKVDNSSIERASGGLQVKASGITNAMLGGSITDAKLNQITTASKVSGTALTGLASIPSGAGVIPSANVPTFATLVASKIYDSGWFAVAVSTSYSKTHSLGTTKVLVQLYFSDNSDGSGFVTLLGANNYVLNGTQGATVISALTTTTISIRTGTNTVMEGMDGDGNHKYPSSGYCRIIMLALE